MSGDAHIGFDKGFKCAPGRGRDGDRDTSFSTPPNMGRRGLFDSFRSIPQSVGIGHDRGQSQSRGRSRHCR